MIAIPRVGAPTIDLARLKRLVARPAVRVGAAALLFVAAASAVAVLLGPLGPAPVRVSLAPAAAAAPEAWRKALRPSHGFKVVETSLVLTEGAPGAAEAVAAQAAGVRGPAGGALAQAPIAGVFAPGPGGPLPVIAPDGRTPFQAYARPFTGDGRPKIALVIGGLGLNARITQTAIETLPPEVTLSFAAYADGLQAWIDMARAHGHEVMLETPMEPVDYPDNDPGPYTLTTGASGPETAKKLEWILSRASGYFALTNYLGSRFLADDAAYEAFAGAVRARGLGFIDDGQAGRRSGGGLPRLSADRIIDQDLSASAIDQQLGQLEARAVQNGQALGAGFAYPVTLDKVAHWTQAVQQRGYQLAPASALAIKK
jgi:polysaccharide deacetylase 2 family uncharacterized protein YibQ